MTTHPSCPKSRHQYYWKIVRKGIFRALSELDRDPFSLTFGSGDREYWAWATKDFSNIDLQRIIYPLSLVYSYPSDNNPWYRNEKIREWILAATRFWGEQQHTDGSFDHHYPYEHSFVAVAFPLYEIAESYHRLEDSLNQSEKDLFLAPMKKGAQFLLKNDELHGFISNHRAGAACALYQMFIITQDEKYKRRAYDFMETIDQKRCKKEGWLCEYGGADPGYQTLDTYYLANFVRLSGDLQIRDTILLPSIEFLRYFIHPDGSIGGEYGSRNCPLFFPSGFELVAQNSPTAEAIVQCAFLGWQNEASPTLLSHDIRNFIPMLSSYSQCLEVTKAASEREKAKLPFENSFECFFPNAGLYIRSEASHYTIVGISKGGVVKSFNKNTSEINFSHCGYMAQDKTGIKYSNQMLHRVEPNGLDDCRYGEVPVQPERQISFDSTFFELLGLRTMNPFRFFLFRCFNLTIGRVKWINDFVRKHIIIGLFIGRRKNSKQSIRRTLHFRTGSLTLDDKVLGTPNWSRLEATENFTTIYMASSKYYRQSDLYSLNQLNSSVNTSQQKKSDNPPIFTLSLPATASLQSPHVS